MQDDEIKTEGEGVVTTDEVVAAKIEGEEVVADEATEEATEVTEEVAEEVAA